MGGPLLEREIELKRLEALVSGARAGRGGLLAVEGPAGIGKTGLLEATARLADAAGVRVLMARGSELEREFGFGLVRSLFERTVASGAPLEGAAALAAPAVGTGPGSDDPDARYAVLHGLHWLTANLAAERPLLLVVDDVQWADEPSVRFLAYLERRLDDLPVALLLAVRPPVSGDALQAMLEDPGRLLAPAPLSANAIATLAERRLGAAPQPEFVLACQRATGGNALLVDELLAEAKVRGAATVEELERGAAERIGRRVARRLAGLGHAATALANAVAVLGDDRPLDVAATLAGVEPAAARRAASALAEADILDDDGLRFRHPLVRAAVLERIPAAELARAHGRAARALAERGAPALVPHLLAAAAERDPWVVATLRGAARDARAQGAPEAAVTYLRRALAEPPPPAERAAVLYELGSAEHVAGIPAAADRLRAAWAAAGEPAARARIAIEAVGALSERGRWREGAVFGREALAALGDADRELGLLLRALVADCVRMEPAGGGDEPQRLRELAATLAGDTAAERAVIATAAVMTPADTAAEHARVAELVRRSGDAVPGFSATGVISNLIRAGRLDDAEHVAEEELEVARGHGFVRRYGTLLSMRGWIALDRGALEDAREDLAAALSLAAEHGGETAPAAAMLALVRAEQGAEDEADPLLDAHGLAGELPEHQVMNVVLHHRSRIRLLQRRHEEALDDALAVGRRYERLGLRRAVPPWRSLAAVLSEDPRLADEELELAERWGTPLALGLALRGLGLVTGSSERLAEAVGALERSPARLELARARIDLGAALRRAGRRAEAREPLRLGMDGAHACGARRLAEHARTELLATGARPRRLALAGSDALTASERRVVALAAGGLTNRRIAQELFVTTATVETHLRHAFRKLGVRSRADLPAVLSGSSR